MPEDIRNKIETSLLQIDPAHFSSFGFKGPTYSGKIASYNIISHNVIAMIGSVVVKLKKKYILICNFFLFLIA